MKLDAITLKNFRCYEDLTVRLHPQLTVLVANNGGGKSSLLNAIAIALADYIRGLPLPDASIPTLDEEDRRRIVVNQALLTTEVTESTTIMLFASDNSEPNFAVMKVIGKAFDPNSIFHHEDKRFLPKSILSKIAEKHIDLVDKGSSDYGTGISKDNAFNLPIISCYGSSREWHKVNLLLLDKSLSPSDLLSRFAPYKDALQFRKNYKSFFHWFEYVAKIHADERNALFEKFAEKAVGMPTQYGQLIKAIRLSIDLCLQEVGWGNITYSHKHQDIMMEHPVYGVMELNRLSDGIRNIIALTGDIALRCVRLNKHLGVRACEETTGIVMIDEVDMHLHPSWQQTVLGSLTQAFPNIQFIVTTHSPQVLSTVPAECIRSLETEVDSDSHTVRMVVATPTVQTQGVPSTDILAAIQRVDPVPDVPPAHWLSEYKALIQQYQHESEVGVALRQKLDQHFGKEHPVMLECERLIRLMAMKKKLPTMKAGNNAQVE